MNKVIKKYMMAIVAVMLVIGFSAFKVVESQKTYQNDLPEDFIPWYFTGDDEETLHADKYSEDDSDVTCGGEEEIICKIYAPRQDFPNTDKPDLNAQVLSNSPDKVSDYIDAAMSAPGNQNLIVESFKEGN